jgi:Domain of unknown function (DUF4349)
MHSPEARDEHVVDALLDGGALLEDPIRMAGVLDELRLHRPEPRPELRVAVAERLATPTSPRRRVPARPSRRLAVASGLLAFCAIGLVGAISLSGGGTSPQALTDAQQGATLKLPVTPNATYRAAGTTGSGSSRLAPAGAAPFTAPSPSGRLQDYQAWMQLRVSGTRRLSQVTQRAISLTRGFDGYVTLSDVNVQGARRGTAVVDVRIPIARVQDAIARFSSLGLIVGEHVAVADLQAGYDAAQRRIESFRHSLALIEVRLADPKVTPEQRLALLAQRERARHALAGATETSTELAARGAYARLDLSFATGAKVAPVVPQRPGRLEHAARRAGGLLETMGIGGIFVLILGVPLLLVAALAALALRGWRRRGERALLERV